MYALANPLKQGNLSRADAFVRLTCNRPHKSCIEFTRGRRAQLRVQRVMHNVGRIDRHQRNRQQPPWPQGDTALQSFGQEMNLTITTQTGCAHRHRLDHGAIGPDLCARRINGRPPAAQQRHIGRRPANVTDQRMIRTGHPTCPDN